MGKLAKKSTHPDGSFRPSAPATREDVAVALVLATAVKLSFCPGRAFWSGSGSKIKRGALNERLHYRAAFGGRFSGRLYEKKS
ncbi:hypothetical protein DK28_0210735 [Peptococcaceae bacterium SCADC1_2_3]|jgi:hypothetical protein|nr:hypothetical protein DK28_0210735 [Peptococcaceae bacterium SCADC1_2_3]KFI35780.1 hypothetical protein HY00_01790 [Peptococcaceae bacterium SCADC1_2_3]